MDVLDVCAALSNETRLRLVSILLNEGPMTSKVAHETFVGQYEQRRRQSIHSALETLVEAEIVEKSYSKPDGGIVYDVPDSRLVVDLESLEVGVA
jgi:DNA-binding transcriptional ArsR family regulator